MRPPRSFTNFSVLDEHAAGAAAGVVDAALVGLQHLDQQPDDGSRRVELAAALALGPGEAAEKVLVYPPKNVAGAVGLRGHADAAHEVDQLAEHDLVERGTGMVLGQDALERGVARLDRQHGVVDILTDRGLLRLGLRCDQRAFFGTQNTFSARYSSGSSASASSSWSNSARFASKASEMYFRKIRPSATCL